MKKWIRRIAVAGVILVVIAAAGGWLRDDGDAGLTAFKTAKIARGSLLVTIDATGTLEPEEVVDVGAQVAGQILTFGTDADGNTVDYGSRVERGTVLANIDPALAEADVKQYKAQVQSAQAGVELAEAKITSDKARVTQAEAQVHSSEANIRRAEADLQQLQAKLSQARRDWERAKKLGPSEALAQATYDSYQSAYEVARANVAVGEASVLGAKADLESTRQSLAIAKVDVTEGQASLSQAKASLAQADTGLWRAQRNLGYCTIASPVKGVVIDRRVNIGQTVQSSFSTPSLFLIAKDLTRMEIWVAVNEADVAKIYSGQPVEFTVDALPDETFQGRVVKTRLNASMTQNVVTYTVEIATDNPDLRLLPYLTANVQFEVERRENVLLVPSEALRWTPSVEQVAAEYRSGELKPDGPTSREHNPPAEMLDALQAGKLKPATIYVREGEFVRPVPILKGMTSGSKTEVMGKDLTEGMEVVTGVDKTSRASSATSNPFTPKLPPRPKGRSGGPPH